MRENKINLGGIGMDKSNELSLALKIMLYDTKALKAILAISAKKPKIKKYIHSKPISIKAEPIANAQAHGKPTTNN